MLIKQLVRTLELVDLYGVQKYPSNDWTLYLTVAIILIFKMLSICFDKGMNFKK